MIKIVFFGTPNYVVPIAQKLHKKFRVIAVVTQAPKKVGRKQLKQYSPIDDWAFKRKAKNIKVYYSCKELESSKLRGNLGVVAAYGSIIPKSTIDLFEYGILNIHPSLLPKFRGASPIQATILTGESQTGVTILKIDEEVDHGPIVSSFKQDIDANETTQSLRKKLFERSADFLTDLIPNYLDKKINLKQQDHKNASFTKQITKQDGFIKSEYLDAAIKGKSLNEEWKIDFIKEYSQKPGPVSIDRFIKAMYPWPTAWTRVKPTANDQQSMAKRLKIIKAHLSSPLTVNHQSLVIDLVQLEGKNPVTWKQFKQGYPESVFGA